MICLCVCQCLRYADSSGICCLLWDAGIALSCQHSFWTGRKGRRVLSCLVILKNGPHFWLIMRFQNLYKTQSFHLSVESSRSASCETKFHAVGLSSCTHNNDFQPFLNTRNNVSPIKAIFEHLRESLERLFLSISMINLADRAKQRSLLFTKQRKAQCCI